MSERSEDINLAEVVSRATADFEAMTGKAVDSVTGVRDRDGSGWSVLVDVVELERIPATTSVLATYRVDLGAGGRIQAYERLRRFNRGAVDPS